MCGLVGIAGALTAADEEIMRRLLIFDYPRGKDATGVAAIRRTKEAAIAKLGSHPLDLFDMGRFRSALVGASSVAFIGHNRAATVGAKTTAGAHPFQCRHITGAHNGTLLPADHRALETELGEMFDVDSEALFAAIARLGLRETLKIIRKGLTPTQGAWALTWYNSEDNTLNFLRNDHRPLWWARSEDRKRMFWASEWEIIFCATKGVPLWKNKGMNFFPLTSDTHYRFDLGKPAEEVTKPVTMKAPGALEEATPTHSYTGWTSGNQLSLVPPEKVKQILLKGGPQDPLAGIQHLPALMKKAEGGCGWCGGSVNFANAITFVEGSTYSGTKDFVLCDKCGDSQWQNYAYVEDLGLYR